jgi:hypothetical protein
LSIKQSTPREHTKQELLTSNRAKGQTPHGPSHTGQPKPDFAAGPNDRGLASHHVSHNNGEAVIGHTVKGNVARDGAPKRWNHVPLSGGATEQQHMALEMGEPSLNRGEPVAGGTPMVPDIMSPGKEKMLTPPKAAFGMKGGEDYPAHIELGQRILGSAARNWGPHEPGAITGKGGVNKF